tara:strand:+ start:1603 stop:2019 length:417 start_codon:yes stop_codon:yes gene_type:complete
MPFEMWSREGLPQGSFGAWYDWRIQHWGTKWDVCEVEIDNTGTHLAGLEFSEKGSPDSVAWFSFRCWTAWGPPVPVWDRLHALGITVDADYQDECGLFNGSYMFGEDENWEPEFEDDANGDPIEVEREHSRSGEKIDG